MRYRAKQESSEIASVVRSSATPPSSKTPCIMQRFGFNDPTIVLLGLGRRFFRCCVLHNGTRHAMQLGGIPSSSACAG